MYTFCPDCNRQYRIRAEQLSAAGGLVLCGFCGRQFNALASLSDRPQKIPPPQPRTSVAPDTIADQPFLREEVRSHMPASSAAVSVAVDAADRLKISEALLDEESLAAERRRNRLWPAGVLLLLLLLALQLAWFNRDTVLQAFPQLAPWAGLFCERYHCNLVRHRDLSGIVLLNRDVRLHPNYADTLLVNATMANKSGSVQPFPGIMFLLFDTNGQILAYREFSVNEYLDHSIDASKGLVPGQPVHIVLEVTGPTQDAVSFEFRFL